MSRARVFWLGCALTGALCCLGLEVTTCPTAGLFAIPCPSCGLTRATLALLEGDLRQANALHPGAIPVLGYLVFASWIWLRQRSSKRWVRLANVTGVLLVVALTMLWIARWFGYCGGPVAVHPWRW